MKRFAISFFISFVLVFATLIIAGCGDTGCEIKEYRITENGITKRCVEEHCANSPIKKQCF